MQNDIKSLPEDFKYPEKLEEYFQELLDKAASEYEIAQRARKKGSDPATHVEMEIAEDIPSVVEAMVGPEGIDERIRELMDEEREPEEISLIIAREIAKGTFSNKGKKERANQAVKTALSIATGAITAAPLEGVTKVEITDDNHLAVHYAGPIRSAGGTETALSVLIADIVRKALDLDPYDIPKKVKERIVEETILYDRHRSLQFSVERKKLEYVLEHVPVEINGEGSTDVKVSGPYRTVKNVDTPRLRTGVALVVNDGLIGKASKLLKIISDFGIEGWAWLQELKKKDSNEKGNKEDKKENNGSSKAYMSDIVVGRPVFSFPSKKGGFRLRYGRARNSGLAALAIHPATMYLLNDFLATGTQIKTGKPGKAAITMPVDSLMPPTVRLKSGDVVKIEEVEEAQKMKEEIEEILCLGDILCAVGEFFENNHRLFPSPIVGEWWREELKNSVKDSGWTEKDFKVSELIKKARQDPFFAFKLTEKLNIPLHPRFTYFWRAIDGQELLYLKEIFRGESKSSLPFEEDLKDILERLLIPHKVNDSSITLEERDMVALKETLDRIENISRKEDNALEILNRTFNIKDKYPVFVGARMGRPEKAKPRKLSPPIHVLFPMGKSGAKNRSITNAAKKGKTSKVEAWTRYCPECDVTTYKVRCQECGKRTVDVKICPNCGKKFMRREYCPSCKKPLRGYKEYEVSFQEVLNSCIENLGFSFPPNVKGVKGLTSKRKIPEPLEKGVLRGKHDVYVFKDGTARFDATDLPLSHFKPKEINVSVEKLRQLGYDTDKEGQPLQTPDQLVELKPQDIIVSKEGLEYLADVAKFIDDLLTKFYRMEPYYELSDSKDLLGELVIGMAPHTSSGIIGRIIGTTKSRGIYSHPYWHAAKRRNCFHPDTKIWVKEESGDWRYEKIKNFVEEKLNPDTVKKDDFGTLFQNVNEEIYVPSINKHGDQLPKRIEAISKHRSTNHLLKIITQSGRDIKVTPDHSMIKWDQGKIEKLEARDLSPGDTIPITKKLDRDVRTLQKKNSPKVKEIQEQLFLKEGGDTWLDEVKCVEFVESDVKYTYSLTVEGTHTLVANDLYTGQCDGDEDAVMLYLDGLLNFSEDFLPDTRGGKMDAPLVIRTILKPEVVDAEVFNIEVTENLPLEFYRNSQDNLNLDRAASIIEKVEDRLGKESQFYGLSYNIKTENINKGPTLSSYKKLGNMEEKAERQLDTMDKISAVDTEKVASKIIAEHLLPDIIGNLRAFGRQEFRCVDCNSKFAICPLNEECPNCGGRVILTVSRGNITKYLSLVDKIIENYAVNSYIKSRYEILKATDLASLERVNRLGNVIKKAKKQGKKRPQRKSKFTIKKDKEIQIEDYF